jgi:hypothetical protein
MLGAQEKDQVRSCSHLAVHSGDNHRWPIPGQSALVAPGKKQILIATPQVGNMIGLSIDGNAQPDPSRCSWAGVPQPAPNILD